MTDGPRQRGCSAASGGDAVAESGKGSGEGGVALKKEIGLVSACGIIVGKLKKEMGIDHVQMWMYICKGLIVCEL